MLEWTDENFEIEVLKSDIPVLVEFKTEWCPTCKKFAYVIESLEEPYKGKVKIGVLDASKNQKYAIANDVLSVPTIIIFKNGQIVKRISGMQSKEDIIKQIDEIIITQS
ncbi:MAG: thioredoxin domain-containing protein [Candidatus Firestonebacteria bacterium]